MNQEPTQVVVRLALDLTLNLHAGATPVVTAEQLQKACDQLVASGVLSASLPADLVDVTTRAAVVPDGPSEASIADHLLGRIEDGTLVLEDIPVRLARYGLMEPHAFLHEVSERMQWEAENA